MNIIEQKFYDSKAFFNTQQTKDISFRKEQLKKLSKAIKSYESDILEALYTDLGKNKVEAYATEIGITLKSITFIFISNKKLYQKRTLWNSFDHCTI